MPATYELRRCDPSLDEDQRAVRDAFAEFFTKESPPSVVRAAEPLGFDATLWTKLTGMGAASMGLPAARGGDDATTADLALVAEQWGRTVAPVPLAGHVAATRLLGRVGAPADVLDAAASGRRIVTLAVQPPAPGNRQLVADAAVAADIVTLTDGMIVLHRGSGSAEQVPNQGHTPLAWWASPLAEDRGGDGRLSLATGMGALVAWEMAVTEWKLLMAAALVGLADASLRLGTEFARTRETLGVPIGALQGVAFPLADVAVELASARALLYKAAWTLDHEPGGIRPGSLALGRGGELTLMALDVARRLATQAATTSAHVQGGLGFTTEADISLYFLRAKGWGALAGDPAASLIRIGARIAAAAHR